MMGIRDSKQGRAPEATVCLSPRTDESLEDLIHRAAHESFDAIEVSLSRGNELSWDATSESCRSIVDKAGRGGVRVATVVIESGPPIETQGPDDDGQDLISRQLKSALEIAHRCGASIVVVPPELVRIGGGQIVRGDQAYATVLDAFSKARFDAMRFGVTLACDFCSTGGLTSISVARSFVDWVNSPFVGLSLSAAEAPYSMEWIGQLGHRIRHVPLDSDHAMFEQIATSLAARRFDGVIAVRGESSAAARRSLCLNRR